MVPLAINAIPAMPLFSMIVLGVSLRTAMIIPNLMFGMVAMRMAATCSEVMTIMPRMLMCSGIASRVPETSVALSVEPSFDVVAGAVQHGRQFIVPVRRGEQGEAIKLQIDQRTVLVEAPILPTCLADATLASADVMPRDMSLSNVAVVVVTSMAISRLGAAGEHEPAREYRADCPVLPTAVFHGHHFFCLRAAHSANCSRGVRRIDLDRVPTRGDSGGFRTALGVTEPI